MTLQKPLAYQHKRSQAQYKQASKAAAGNIVGRKVDAPHIIVPSSQGCSTTLIDFEPKDPGSITQQKLQCYRPQSTMQLTGPQHDQYMVSLSPQNSPWQKLIEDYQGLRTGSCYNGKSKNNSLFGQVKLNFNQGSSEVTTTQNRKAVMKNFKSQPGGRSGNRSKNRNSKSIEQAKNLTQQTNAHFDNFLKPRNSKNWKNQTQYKNSISHATGRKTALHGSRNDKLILDQNIPDLQLSSLRLRRPSASKHQQRSQIKKIEDQPIGPAPAHEQRTSALSSSIQIQNCQPSESAQNQITLNILTATADQLGGATNAQSFDREHHQSGSKKSHSATASRNQSSQSRQLIKTKYLNFQRDVHHNRKRQSKSLQLQQQKQHRMNYHRASVTKTKNAANLSNNSKQQLNQTQINTRSSGLNPFQQQRQSSSQCRAATALAENSSMGIPRPHATKKSSNNNLMKVKLRHRSKSRQGTSCVLSDSPKQSLQSQNRANSGGSHQRSQQRQFLGSMESLSPRIRRPKTQFKEARSLLLENIHNGIGINQKKRDLNPDVNIDVPFQQQSVKEKPANYQGNAGSQQNLVAQIQSVGTIDQANNNMSAVLLQARIDPNNSLQQYLRGALKDDLRQPSAAEATKIDEQSQKMVQPFVPNLATKKYVDLNVSLGRIFNQSTISNAAKSRKNEGNSQSPNGNRVNQQRTSLLRGSNQISSSNTSRIDKLISDNLKKQGKKTLQHKMRQKEEEQVTRKKKAQLELNNE